MHKEKLQMSCDFWNETSQFETLGIVHGRAMNLKPDELIRACLSSLRHLSKQNLAKKKDYSLTL